MFWKIAKLNNRIKQVVLEIKNIMIKLEAGRIVIMINITSTTNILWMKLWQAVSKFRDESDYSDLANWLKLSLKYQSNDCNQLQLVLLLTICNRKSLMIQMWVIIIYYLGHSKHSCILHYSLNSIEAVS